LGYFFWHSKSSPATLHFFGIGKFTENLRGVSFCTGGGHRVFCFFWGWGYFWVALLLDFLPLWLVGGGGGEHSLPLSTNDLSLGAFLGLPVLGSFLGLLGGVFSGWCLGASRWLMSCLAVVGCGWVCLRLWVGCGLSCRLVATFGWLLVVVVLSGQSCTLAGGCLVLLLLVVVGLLVVLLVVGGGCYPLLCAFWWLLSFVGGLLVAPALTFVPLDFCAVLWYHVLSGGGLLLGLHSHVSCRCGCYLPPLSCLVRLFNNINVL